MTVLFLLKFFLLKSVPFARVEKISINTPEINLVISVVKMSQENKIISYLLLTALMVVSFASAMVINHTSYGSLAWIVLLIINLGILIFILRK